MGEICVKCGKKLSWFERLQDPKSRAKNAGFREKHPELLGKKLCKVCYVEIYGEGAKDYLKRPFREALQQGRRIVVIKDVVLSADGIGKHIELYSNVAEEFEYVYKSETHFPDKIGISLSIIFEKVISTANETNFVNCEHCTTRYDANQYFKCPQCGSPTT